MRAERPSLLRAAVSAVALLVGLPVVFYFYFDARAVPFACGIAVFFVAIVLVSEVAVRAAPAAENDASPQRPTTTLDKVAGAVWLLSSSFGVLLGWLATSLPAMRPDTYAVWLWVRIALAGILPVASLLAMLRGVRGGFVGVAIFVGITCLPVASTTGALRDYFQGPGHRDGQPYLRGVDRPITR